MFCCANCFGDSHLNKHIPKISKKTGVCDFCSASNISLVNPISLSDLFQSVCSIYAEDTTANAKLLVTWFQQDWQMFTSLGPIKAQALLGEILDNGEVVRKKYLPRHIPHPSAIEKWTSFCDEMRLKNRFFFQNDLDLNRLTLRFTLLQLDSSAFNDQLYRARIHPDDKDLLLNEMGRPPAALAKNGRANPVGISYLYTASKPETAIAETRPHPGDHVSVARFQVKKPLLLLNLKEPRRTISPFNIDEDELLELRHELDFLCHLGSELSKPILPRVADLEYLPTQYLSEFIKKSCYDGIVFTSSVGDGANITLFDDSNVSPIELTRYRVTNVRYDQEQRGAP